MFKSVLLWLLFSMAVLGCALCGATNSNTTGVCLQFERDALLEVKSTLIDPSNRLASWSKIDMDCCTWLGVICHRLTGHVLELHLGSSSFGDYASTVATSPSHDSHHSSYVFQGELSPSLLKLKYLRYLDLSNNDFGGVHIPNFLGSIESLSSLNLSRTMFGGNILHQLRNLSNLRYLNLKSDSNILHCRDLSWLSSLSSLEHLDLSGVNLANTFNWLNDINQVSSLRVLHLKDCQLPNPKHFLQINISSLSILDLSINSLSAPLILSWISQLQSLKILNLADNVFSGPFPNGLKNLSALVELDLLTNRFNSSIPNWIGNLTSLMLLDLSNSSLVGRIPRSFENLCNLRSLNLYNVNLKQEIGEVLDILVGCASNSLEILDLSKCELYGHISNDIGKFKSMEQLYLGLNKLDGVIPLSLGRLRSLEYLSFSSNFLVGDVYEVHFANLSNLTSFSASGNKLSLRVSAEWLPPFQQIKRLGMGSWVLGSQIPTWLRSLNQLWFLNLSNTGISGAIPNWFWKSSLLSQFANVDLSKNNITQVFSNKNKYSFELSVAILDLSANILTGPIPSISSSVWYLRLSDNSLSGSLSHFLCSGVNRTNQLKVLDVERNQLEGKIPNCWMYWDQLEIIKLSNNKFHGDIPISFGTLETLKSLHIQSNNLSGKLPMSFKHCSQLRTLDLGDNQLEGNVPDWIGRWLNMVILVLRGNKFYGQIPDSICQFISLQILDLAANYFDGPIPNCIGNFTAMVATSVSLSPELYYIISFGAGVPERQEIVVKGGVAKYSSTLNLVRSIDLSRNNLFGLIPVGITNLTGLRSLNLSHNFLFGEILENIGSMKGLESLDLSQNQLSGKIPQSVANLNFLSYLNFSNNNLSGRIPQGTQLQGFDASSFFGNKELCGKPLTNNCSEDGFTSGVSGGIPNANNNGLQMDWFYVGLVVGFIVSLCGVLAPLMLSRSWR